MIRFSISTAWNVRIASNVYSMVAQLRKMGFCRIELNFTLTYKDVCDIISLKKRGEIEVTSLHNFCPVPEGVDPRKASPDYYSLSSQDEFERKKAIEATKATIETAAMLEAEAVVLHLGRVEIKDRTRKLASTIKNIDSYIKMKNLMFEERKNFSMPYFQKALDSLEKLLSFTESRRIKLGIENRYYYNEIPSLDELELIFEHFDSEYIGYWHDTGHAQIFQNLGLFNHKRDYLDRFGSRMIGVHLHDIEGVFDHKAPLEGSFDFSILRPYLTKDTILVLEPHQPTTSDKIKKGVDYLTTLYGDLI